MPHPALVVASLYICYLYHRQNCVQWFVSHIVQPFSQELEDLISTSLTHDNSLFAYNRSQQYHNRTFSHLLSYSRYIVES